MTNAPLYEPAVVAQKLLPVLSAAAEQGHRFFTDWFEDFSKYTWARHANMHNLSIPVEPKKGRAGWAKFRGGGTRGDGHKMYVTYRRILENHSVIETVDPSDSERRLCGAWSVDLPVPLGGPRGWDETWRIAREMFVNADPIGPVPLGEVRNHVRRCESHARKDPHRRPERHAHSEHSRQNRHSLAHLRVGVELAVMKINPQRLVVALWPDGDYFDSADMAVFAQAAAVDPIMVVKCGLGNADDPEMKSFVELVKKLRKRCASFLYFALREPEPDLLRVAEEAGIDVLSVMRRRVLTDKVC